MPLTSPRPKADLSHRERLYKSKKQYGFLTLYVIAFYVFSALKEGVAEIKAGFWLQENKAIFMQLFLNVFSTLKEGVAGGGERLPSGKHRLPLPQEGVWLKTCFCGFSPDRGRER